MNQNSPPSTPASSVDEAIELSRRVRTIDTIVQTGGRFSVNRDRLGSKMATKLLERSPTVRLDGDVVTVGLGFRLEARNADSDATSVSDLVIEADASFVVSYTLKESFQCSEAGLAAFGELNGRFNLIAYWRQYLNDCLSRAGLPPLHVPPFNAAARISALRRTAVSESNSADPAPSEG